MNTYKILIVCPWWGRPDIVELHCRSMKRFMKEGVDYLAILSPEDPYLKELENLIYSYGFKKTYFKNVPLGHKINHGFKTKGYDYIMNMGSDNLCNPDYWKGIKGHMGKPLIKVNHIYAAKDISLKEIWEIRDINIGVLRMIRTDIITKDLYPAKNKGLDKGSRIVLDELGYKEEVVNFDKPMVIDVKSKDNITPLRNWLKKNGRKVKIDLKKFL